MDSQSFTPSEVENLQRLIGENHHDDVIIKNEEVRDSDILFFSQYGTLAPSTGDDMDFQILPGLDNENTPSDNFNVTPEELSTISALEDTNEVKNERKYVTKYKEQLDGKSTRIFECGVCGKEFSHQYTLMRHLPTHTDERKFHCLTCGKSFRQMSTLSQHRAIHSSDRPYVCEICQKNFNRVSTLISHKKTHSGEKPHMCPLCNKAFHQKGNLRNHIFTHTNERPYKCDICFKGFNQMSNLMCHKMKAHQQSDVLPRYPCRVCGEEFLKRINLRQHEQYKHGMLNLSGSTGMERKFEYGNAILVNPIKTDAMRLALESGETPFALLRPLSGIPVLVRVLPAGDKQMLVPATAEDLKKYGHISITPKVADCEATDVDGENKDNQGKASKSNGSVVQIKVPVVATVIQRSGLGGSLSMSVCSPGPGDVVDESGGSMSDLGTDSFIYSSTLAGSVEGNGTEGYTDNYAESISESYVENVPGTKTTDHVNGIDALAFDDNLMASLANAEIEFIDQNGAVIPENDFQKSLDLSSVEFSYNNPKVVSLESSYENDKNKDSFLLNADIQLKSMPELDNSDDLEDERDKEKNKY